MTEHVVAPLAQTHPILGLGPYANEAARIVSPLKPTGGAIDSTDVGKTAYQTDTGAVWYLASVAPLRWVLMGGPIPIRPQTGAGVYTCTIDDAGALVPFTNAAAVTPTIPPNSAVPYKVGDTIMFEQQGAGLMTIAPGVGVTFEGSSFVSSGTKSVLCATQRILDTWVIYGKTT